MQLEVCFLFGILELLSVVKVDIIFLFSFSLRVISLSEYRSNAAHHSKSERGWSLSFHILNSALSTTVKAVDSK